MTTTEAANETVPSRKWKCSFGEHGIIEPCSALAELSEYSHSRKGVVCWSMMNIQTGKPTRDIYGAKSGVHAKKGVAFNFCPICGTQLINDDGEVKPT